MRLAPVAAALGVLVSAPAHAQTFTGTFTTQNDQGGTVALVLTQDARGNVTGTLSGAGNTFQVRGVLEGAATVGSLTNPQFPSMFFQAELAGTELVLTLVAAGPDNQPDFSQTQEVRFQRQGTAAGGGLGQMLGGAEGTADPWVGSWSDGNLTLTLEGGGGRYTGGAQLQGQRYPVTASGSNDRISGTYEYAGQHLPWQAQIQDGIMVMQVDGQTLRLQKGGAAQAVQPGGPAAAGGQGAAQLSAQGREWHQHLSGKRLTQRSSHYSGPAIEGAVGGGYSSRRTMDVCSDGRFFYSSRDRVALDGDGVSGSSRGNEAETGQWRIIEQGGLVGIEFRWQDGSVTQHRLDYQQNRTLIDGERTFVTNDNSSCP